MEPRKPSWTRKRWLYAEKKAGNRVRSTIGDTSRVGHIVRIRNPIARYVQYLVHWDVHRSVMTDPEYSWMAEDDVQVEKE